MLREKPMTERNISKWLLDFERQAGKPILVTLLIKKGKVSFIASCIEDQAELTGLNDNSYMG
jgi:hypothetical protein